MSSSETKMAILSPFESLGAELLSMICMELYALSTQDYSDYTSFELGPGFEALRSLNKVSKICHTVAFPILCRRIIMYNDQEDEFSVGIVKSILDNVLSLRLHVRECVLLNGRHSNSKPLLIASNTWREVFGNLASLRDLTWLSYEQIERNLLSQLAVTNPRLRITIQIPRELSPWLFLENHLTLVNNILNTSPLITGLVGSIEWHSCEHSGNSFSASYQTELNQISLYIKRTSTIRHVELALGVNPIRPCLDQDSSLTKYSLSDFDLKNRQFPTDLQLPHLQTLFTTDRAAPAAGRGILSSLTCMLMKHAATWTTAKTLKLRQLSAVLPWDQLAGRCPNLRELQLFMHFDGTFPGFDTASPPVFVASLKRLQDVVILSGTGVYDAIFQALCSSRMTLRDVSILLWRDWSRDNSPCQPHLSARQLQEMSQWPRLQELLVDLPVEDARLLSLGPVRDNDAELSGASDDAVSRLVALANLKSLTKLYLKIRIPDLPNFFADLDPGARDHRYRHWIFKPQLAKDAAVSLWRMVYDGSGVMVPKLRELSITFNWTNCSNTWNETIKVRWMQTSIISDLDSSADSQIDIHTLQDGRRFLVEWKNMSQ